MGISLLPDELRKNEEVEKEKVKGAMGLPKFKMHAAESVNGKSTAPLSGQSSGPSISFDEQKPILKEKGMFRVVPKNPPPAERPRIPNIPPPIERPRVPSIPPPAAVNAFREKITPPPNVFNMPVPPTPEHAFRMRLPAQAGLPEAEKEVGVSSKKVLRETHDKIDDLKKPPALFATLKKDIFHRSGKMTPADLNLIAEDYPAIVRAQFWRRMQQLIAVVLFFVVLGCGGYAYVKWQKLALLKQYQEILIKTDQTDSEINSFSMEGKQLEALKDRAAALQVLLDNHVYWTAFLGQLEKVTIENVRYYNLVAETNGDILLSARAKKYEDAAWQLAALEQADFVETAEISALTQAPLTEVKTEADVGQLPVEFSIKLKLKPSFLSKQ